MKSLRRFLTWLLNYLRESRREMQKVNWPARRDVIRMTLIVILFSAVIALILGGFDFLFSRAVFRALPEGGASAPGPFPPPDVSTQPIPLDISNEPPPSEPPPQ